MAEGTDILVDLLKQLNEASDKGILGAGKKDLKRLNEYKDTFKDLTKSIDKQFNVGFEKSSKTLMNIQKKLTQNVSNYSSQINKCITKLSQDISDVERASAEEKLKQLQKEFEVKIKEQRKLAKVEQENADKILKQYNERFKLNFEGQVSEMKLGSSLESAFNNVTGALTDFNSTGSLIGTGLKGLASLIVSAQAKKAYEEQRGGLSSGVARKALGGVSKLVLGVGAVVGGLFAVVKAFQAIEGAGKKVNKDLLSSASATDLMAKGSLNAYKSINQIRRDLTSYDFATNLGLTTDEVITMYGQLNQMGITMRQLGGDSEKLFGIMKELRKASYGLGVDFNSAGEYANEFRLELGMSANSAIFQGKMADEFKNIRDLALQSSYSTSQFFNKIKDLTDGVGKFNVRTVEAGKILLSLTKVIGPKAAEEFTKGLVGAFGQEGYVDRIKRLMTTNKGNVDRALESSAKATANQFKRDFLSEGSKTKGIFESLGLDTNNLLKSVRGMSEKDITRLLGELQLGGEQTQGASRKLLQLLDLAGYKKGTMGRVRALGATDVGGSLNIDIQRVLGVLGDKSIRQASLGQLKMLESLGVDKDKVETYGKIIDQKRAEFEALKAKDVFTVEDQKKFGITKKGDKFFNAETNEEIKNLGDYLQAQGARLKEGLGVQAPTLESIMTDSVRATQTLGDKINNYLGSIMQGVYNVTMGIYNKIFSDQSEQSRSAQEGAITQLIKEQQDINNSFINLRENIRKKESSLGGKSLPEQKKIKKEIAEMKEKEKVLALQKEVNKQALSDIQKDKYTDIENVDSAVQRAKSRGLSALAVKDSVKGAKAGELLGVDKESLGLEKVSRLLGYKDSRAMLDAFSGGSDELKNKIRSELRKSGQTIEGDMGIFSNDKIKGTKMSGLVVRGKDGRILQTATGTKEETEVMRFNRRQGAATKQTGTREVAKTELNVKPFDPNDPDMKKGRKEDADELAKNTKLKKRDIDVGYEVGKKLDKDRLRASIASKLMGIEGIKGITQDTGLSELQKIYSQSNIEEGKKGEIGELLGQAGALGYFDDGLIMQNGTARRISSEDNVLAFKKDGPVSNVLGGGGRANIAININGNAPDMENRVKKAVYQALRESNVVIEP